MNGEENLVNIRCQKENCGVFSLSVFALSVRAPVGVYKRLVFVILVAFACKREREREKESKILSGIVISFKCWTQSETECENCHKF